MRILTVGDSWAAGHVADDQSDTGWPVMLGIPDDLRQAVDGSTAVQWASDFDGRLTKAAQTEADVVIISLLGNDALRAMSDGSISPQEAAAGLDAFVATVERVRKARTIVMLYSDPTQGKDFRTSIGCVLLNAAIVGKLPNGVETFRTSAVLRPEHFDGKDIHPTRKGHEAIAAGLRVLLGV